MNSRLSLAKYMTAAAVMKYDETNDGDFVWVPLKYVCIKWRDINWQHPAYAQDVRDLRNCGWVVRESASNLLVYKPRFASYAEKKAHRKRMWYLHQVTMNN